MSSLSRPIALLFSTLALSSCATHRSSDPSAEGAALAPDAWSNPVSQAVPTRDWIADFRDPELSRLAALADERNFGLEAAERRTNAARAAARISSSLRGPSFDLGLRSGESKSLLLNFDPPISSTNESHALTLSARWELDLWNRLGNSRAAAFAEYQASEYDLEALRLSLAGQVAKAWFDAIEAKLQYELATATAQSFETNLETLERRYTRGMVDAFDLRLIRSQAASSRAAAVNRRSQMDTAIRRLEVLLGSYPAGALEAANSLPKLGAPPATGLPSEVLARRPDILAEQERLHAAFFEAKAARRNWLPSFVLTGSQGGLSSDFSKLLEDDFNVWSLVGELRAALFQSGRLKAERAQFDALQLSRIAQYKDSVLQAFREVESALRAETDFAELERQTAIAAEESAQAEEQAWRLYERGLTDITAVLDAQRRSFESRSQLISTKNRRLQNRTNLHLALGGNFDP